MPTPKSRNTTTTTPMTINSIADPPCLPLRQPALSKRNGGLVAMIEKPNVDELLAGPLGQWLEQQAVVRAEARRKSNRRFMIASVVAVPVMALFWLAQVFGDWNE